MFACLSGYSQKDNYGTEFWTGFLGNLLEFKGDSNHLQLYVAARQNTNVTVTIPSTNFSVTKFVLSSKVTVFDIPRKLAFIDKSETIEKKGVYIVSDYPIAVSAMNVLDYSSGASVVFPLKSLIPRATFVTVHPDLKDEKNSLQTGLSEFLLVGTEDGTAVEITVTARTNGGKKPHTTFGVTLNKGETYMVTSPDNLDGSTIKVLNKKRLAVYTGNRCSYFPCGACDNQVEQLLSNELLDTVYYALPQYGHDSGYFVKVISIDGPLWIKVNGEDKLIPAKDSGLVFNINKGDSVFKITSKRKFACFQFLKGMNCNGYTLNLNYSQANAWGDPSTVQLMSHAFFSKNSMFSTVTSNNLQAHYVSLLVPSNGINSVYLDGNPVATNKFRKIKDDPKFSYAMLELTYGTHSIRADSGHIAYSYGLGLTESYMYLAAYSLPIFELYVFDSTLSYDCKKSTVTMQFEAERIGAVDYWWDFGDGKTDTGQITTHTFKVPGTYKLRAKTIAFNGKIDSFSKVYTLDFPEFNPVYDKILCDSQFTFQETNTFFTNFKWQDNSTKNNFTVDKDAKLWVTATDTGGVCTFKDSAKIILAATHARLYVDTLAKCYSNNLFRFRDSIAINNDLISHRILRYTSNSYWGNSKAFKDPTFEFKFNRTGKFNVYIDVYPANSSCFFTYTVPVNVLPSPRPHVNLDKDKYCHGETVTIYDSSTLCCGKIVNYFGWFDDSTFIQSKQAIISGKVFFDYKQSSQVKKIKFFTETSEGCFDTSYLSLQVFPPASPKFDFGNDSTKCLVLSRWTFTHTVNTNLTGIYDMLWDFGNGKTGNQSQYKNFRYMDTGTYQIKFSTKTDQGCRDSLIRHVKVIEQPYARFSVDDSIQCLKPNQFVFVDKSVGKFLQYKWKFGDGKTSNLQNPWHTYDSSGKHKVKLIVNAPYPGCFDDSLTHNAEVLKMPVASFSTLKDSLCFNSKSITPIDKSIFFNGADKYFWTSGKMIDSSLTPPMLLFKDTGALQIQLVVKDKAGCKDTFIKVIQIKPQPAIGFTINDTIQCYGQNKFIIKQDPVDAEIKTLSWKLDDVFISNTSDAQVLNSTQIGLHKIVLDAETFFGCRDSLTKYIEVLPPLNANFTLNKDTQCFYKQSFNLTNSSIVLKDAIESIKYFYKSGLIGTTSDLTDYIFGTSGEKRILMELQTVEGCFDSLSKKAYVIQNPEVSFNGDTVCLGDSVILTGLQTKGDFSITQWNWQMRDGDTYPTSIANHIYKAAGVYNPILQVSDRYGCSAQSQGLVIVNILPKPQFKFDILSSDKQFTYVKLIPDYKGYSSYLWSFPDGSQNNEESPLINFKRFFEDYIRLKVVDLNGCSDTVSQFLFIYPPIDELWIENAFTPNNDQLNDVFKPTAIDGAKDYRLRIFNRWGELIFSSNDVRFGWDGTFKGEPVQDGVYIFTVEFKYPDGNRYDAKGNVTLVR
jgi:gliding motility-associated-like protein